MHTRFLVLMAHSVSNQVNQLKFNEVVLWLAQLFHSKRFFASNALLQQPSFNSLQIAFRYYFIVLLIILNICSSQVIKDFFYLDVKGFAFCTVIGKYTLNFCRKYRIR